MTIAYLTQDAWPLFLLSLMLSFAAFPIVFLCAFLYSRLTATRPGAPKLLWMWLVTLFGTLIGVFLFYVYLGATLSELLRPS